MESSVIYPKLILDALSKVRYPGNGKNLVELEMVADDIRIDGQQVSFSIIFKKRNDPFMKSVVKAAETAVVTYVSEAAQVTITPVIAEPTPTVTEKKPPIQAKHIIAISSGKGGVGKSTVSCNLAVALALQGYKVGLLDADIHGPSQPKMFGVEGAQPIGAQIDGRNVIEPVEKYGVKMLSIGFFVNPDSAVVWRGGMASNAIKQLVNDANWGELDYFLIDLPPGTSDIHLTMVDVLKLTGAIVVTTPQPVALADARKGVDMFKNEKIAIPVLGIVENMAWFTPAELPQNRYYIFGQNGGKHLAEELRVPLLVQIPLVQTIREGADTGEPVALQTGHPAANFYVELARKIAQP